jgi:hypothetical protein
MASGDSLRKSLRTVTVRPPSTMEALPAALASWPEMGTLPARPWTSSACSAPRAVPSFEATTASTLLFNRPRMSSMMRAALAASQFCTHSSATIRMRPLSMRGLRTSIWPLRSSRALLSVGLPPRRTKLPLLRADRTPRACARPTSTLSNET